MARPWRLRHKLVLGLGLLVGSVALLLGGALFGLSSYMDAMQTTRRKLDEMKIAVQLRDHIRAMGAGPQRSDPAAHPTNPEREHIAAAAKVTRATLAGYRATLRDDTVRRNLDPDDGESETDLIDRMERALDRLEDALRASGGGQIGTPSEPRLADARVIDDPDVRAAHNDLTRLVNDLFLILVADVEASFDRSNANHRRSVYIAGSATALAVVLVLTLLHYFRVWVFAPIRELQAGVHRVHGGDFDHPIRLASNDELEELADEFNAMTARLRDVYANLAQQVNDRTRQLVRSERMVSVGFLAAGVAHEINNPLASIAFCAEALERRLQDVLVRAPAESEVVLKYLRMMQDEAQRCKQITQRLLDFSRSGGRREATDLNQLVRDVVEVARVLPVARGKTVAFEPDGVVVAPVSVPEVKGVVLNVVVNALESMDDDGYLTVSVAARGEFAEMTFTDTGCGMTPDVLENIFEPFFTRSRTGNGTGLGLATSHLIIDQHGGAVTASSPGPGKGSTFTVRLPLRAAEARSQDPGDRGQPRDGVVPFPAGRAAAA